MNNKKLLLACSSGFISLYIPSPLIGKKILRTTWQRRLAMVLRFPKVLRYFSIGVNILLTLPSKQINGKRLTLLLNYHNEVSK